MNDVNVNYGCGLSVAEGWINFDASPTLRLSKLPVIGHFARRKTNFPRLVQYGDITDKLPIANASVDRVYCSHVLEHLSYEDCLQALRETHRIMKPGAVFRGVMPDLSFEINRYSHSSSANAAHDFIEATGMGCKARPMGLGGLAAALLGNSQHLWLWDYPALAVALQDCGFSNIRRASFRDHDDPVFAGVEVLDRWENCLGWSCIRS